MVCHHLFYLVCLFLVVHISFEVEATESVATGVGKSLSITKRISFQRSHMHSVRVCVCVCVCVCVFSSRKPKNNLTKIAEECFFIHLICIFTTHYVYLSLSLFLSLYRSLPDSVVSSLTLCSVYLSQPYLWSSTTSTNHILSRLIKNCFF